VIGAHNQYRSTDADRSHHRPGQHRSPGSRTPPASATRTGNRGTPPRSRNAQRTPRCSEDTKAAPPHQTTKTTGWS
jgi:hypothetical protein